MALRRTATAIFSATPRRWNTTSANASNSAPGSTINPASQSLTVAFKPESLPHILKTQQQPHKTLYELLSSLPENGVGMHVRQRRWAAKGLDIPKNQAFKGPLPLSTPEGSSVTVRDKPAQEGHLCYWEITRVRLKEDGKHGKAWGRLVWRGELLFNGKEQRIKGGLKHMWLPARHTSTTT